MKRITHFCLAACLTTTVLAVGCQSPGMITRGQSPAPFPESQVTQAVATQAALSQSAPQAHPGPQAPVVQTAHQSPHEKKQAVIDAINDHHHEKHNTTTTYSSEVQTVQGNGQYGGCPTGNCPSGGYAYGNGGYQGGYCPPEHYHGGFCPGGHCGNDLNHYPRHHFSQSYKAPNDLSYPAQNSIGGAVVYPYYTHKGPSDFFRKH